MATNYPVALDDFTNYIDSTTIMEAATLNNMQFAIEALQAKVGINSSIITSSHDFKLANSPNATVNGSIVPVFTKYLTGITDNDSETIKAHGITGIDNILAVSFSVFGSTAYAVGDFRQANSATSIYQVSYDGTNVIIAAVGSTFQGNKYRIKIDYIL